MIDEALLRARLQEYEQGAIKAKAEVYANQGAAMAIQRLLQEATAPPEAAPPTNPELQERLVKLAQSLRPEEVNAA